MGYIHNFEDAYKTLENTLRVATGITNKPIISLYIKILPPALSAQMDTIRKFRNNFPGHGAKVGGESPKPPSTYISFLNKQIDWVDSHRAEVSKKMRQYTSNNRNSSSSHYLEKKEKQKSSKKITSYRSIEQQPQLSYDAEMIRKAIATHKNEVEPQRKKLKHLVIKAISHWSSSDKMLMLTEYGCHKKLFQSLDDALANAILINMSNQELNQLLSMLD